MRIGTWNVEYAAGGEKNDRRLRRLREMDCDLWVLTETHDDLDLGHGYHAVSTTHRVTGRAGARWTSIWSRFPIMKAVLVEDSNRTVAALIESPLGPLVVYGTVLPWHTDLGPKGNAEAWSEHHRIVPRQGQEWATLRAAYPQAALVVAGDFNMNLGGRHHYGTAAGREMLRAGLRGAALVCITETERVPVGLSHAPIDHICLSEQLAPQARVAEAWEGTDAERVRLSDHIGLVVEIEAAAS
jgi:hypothetical protein